MKLVQIEGDVREKVKSLLKELFQFENQDLDFGIPRIMNFKRKEIERFIEKDLLEAAEERFKEYAQVGVADLQKDVERLRAEIVRDFGEGTIDEQGNVKKHEDAPKIKEYVGKTKELESARLTQVQMDDVFNHIYEFFSRYYDKGDFISKRRYGGREKYYVPYNGEEVLFHWANNDQYYVKSGEYFKKYSFKAGGYKVNFVLKEAEVELNDVRDETKYFLLREDETFKLDEEKKELEIFFNWRVLVDEEKKKYGTRNVQETIVSDAFSKLLSEIGDKGPATELRRKVDEENTLLEKHLKKYAERNTTDYFIHKNLRTFLERELDFYIKNEALDLDEIESMDESRTRLNKAKMRAIREISKKIIEFLAQIENFQKMLFEKRKFVLKTDYCMTLDNVPKEFYPEIAKNEVQVTEWKKLLMLDEITKNTFYPAKGKKTLTTEFLKENTYLVLDTQYFDQSFKDRLLNTFDKLDEKIEGVIIKSENFQALNLIRERYKGKVKCVYLDPPYNTGEDNFLYKDNYQHSSWLSMMHSRLSLANQLLESKGIIFVSIDDNEIHNLGKLMDSIFERENLLAQIIWNLGTGTQAGHFTRSHEYVLAYARDKKSLPYFESDDNTPIQHGALKRISKDNPATEITFPKGMEFEGENATFKGEVGGEEKEIIVSGKMVFEKGRLKEPVTLKAGWAMRDQILSWLAGNETYDSKGQKVVRFFFNKEGILWYEKERVTFHPKTVLTGVAKTKDGTTEVENLFGRRVMVFPKPSKLIGYLTKPITKDNDIILDFFAGSGTTAHAVINLNNEDLRRRKYILVEMDGDFFDSILKPRIQKLMYSREWDKCSPHSKQGTSHMFKYLRLEQYEDTLSNIVFRESDKSVQETLDSFRDYFLRYMLDYETRESPTRLIIDKFQTPFDYKIKTISENEEREETVDLVETFNYLLGLNVERLRAFNDGERIYRIVFGGQENKSVVIIWRNTKNLDLEKDKKFIEEKILSDNTYDLIFVNGDSYIKNAKPIEPEFKRLMGA